jgi:hypothetical protein
MKLFSRSTFDSSLYKLDFVIVLHYSSVISKSLRNIVISSYKLVSSYVHFRSHNRRAFSSKVGMDRVIKICVLYIVLLFFFYINIL